MENVLHIYSRNLEIENDTRLPPMKKFYIYRPVIISCLFAGAFVISLAMFGQMSEAQIMLAAEQSSYEGFTALLGLITQVSIAVMFLVALIWFVWRGKSVEQLKEIVAGWKDTAERGRLRIAELEAECAKEKAETTRLKAARIEDRKKILRLTGRLAGEDLEELHTSDGN